MNKYLIPVLGLAAVVATAIFAFGFAPGAYAATDSEHPPELEWAHHGILGTFDKAAVRRGLQVYREVCAGCHGLKYVAFRNLVEIGLTEDQVKAIAAEYDIGDGPDQDGEMFTRPGILSDYMPSPFANENAARSANGGALPPDLSLIVKARPGGEDYINAIISGFSDEPEGSELGDFMSYNRYFAGSQIAMAPPLYEDGVEYADGTAATVEQMAHDVTTFLAWSAEPTLDARKTLGLKVMIYLIILTIMMYFVNQRVWRKLKS